MKYTLIHEKDAQCLLKQSEHDYGSDWREVAGAIEGVLTRHAASIIRLGQMGEREWRVKFRQPVSPEFIKSLKNQFEMALGPYSGVEFSFEGFGGCEQMEKVEEEVGVEEEVEGKEYATPEIVVEINYDEDSNRFLIKFISHGRVYGQGQSWRWCEGAVFGLLESQNLAGVLRNVRKSDTAPSNSLKAFFMKFKKFPILNTFDAVVKELHTEITKDVQPGVIVRMEVKSARNYIKNYWKARRIKRTKQDAETEVKVSLRRRDKTVVQNAGLDSLIERIEHGVSTEVAGKEFRYIIEDLVAKQQLGIGKPVPILLLAKALKRRMADG